MKLSSIGRYLCILVCFSCYTHASSEEQPYSIQRWLNPDEIPYQTKQICVCPIAKTRGVCTVPILIDVTHHKSEEIPYTIIQSIVTAMINKDKPNIKSRFAIPD